MTKQEFDKLPAVAKKIYNLVSRMSKEIEGLRQDKEDLEAEVALLTGQNRELMQSNEQFLREVQALRRFYRMATGKKFIFMN